VYERVRPNFKPAAQLVGGKRCPEGIARDEANRRETEKRKKAMKNMKTIKQKHAKCVVRLIERWTFTETPESHR
jgi:hypothetical protein